MRPLPLLFLLLSLPAFAQSPCDELEASFIHETHPDGIQFQNTSHIVGALTWYQWNFGDGTLGFVQDPIHNYQINGQYEVCLSLVTVIESGGDTLTCEDVFCTMVEFTEGSGFTCDQYTASFEFEAGGGNSMVFHSTTEPVGGNHHWQFGDGTEGSGTQITHTYDAPGDHWVCLVSSIWNDVSQEFCLHSSCQSVSVGDTISMCDDLVASFTSTVLENNTVLFHHTTEPAALGFNWDFGNNMTGTGPEIVHDYAGAGTYQVCLTAWWWDDVQQDTCWNSYCDLIHLTAGNDCDTSFQVDLGWSQSGGITTLSAMSSGVAAGGYQWLITGTEGLTADVIDHEFEPGTHEVCLIGWHLPEGTVDTCYADRCRTLHITHGQTTCDDVDVTFEATSAASGLQFFSIPSGTVLPTAYEWTFGDGGTSGEVDPFHAYADASTYEVCLTTTSVIGTVAEPDTCISTSCHQVIYDGGVGDPCTGFEASFTGHSGNGLNMIFNSTSTPGAVGAHWNFGDGNTASGVEVVHGYQLAGTYLVCLETWWWNEALQDTCWRTICDNFTVTGPLQCDPGFTVDFEWAQTGHDFVFHSISNHPDLEHIWTFGDNTSAAGAQATHTYSEPGQYEVCLHSWYWNESVMDSCWATTCQLVDWIIVDMCDPTFAVSISAQPDGSTVHFTANADQEVGGHIWDLGDGHSAAGQSVSHSFKTSGMFTVCVDSWYWIPALGDSCWAEACINLEVVVGIREQLAAGVVNIHPIPARDALFIAAPADLPLPDRLELRTMDGRLVRRERVTHWPHAIALDGMSSGMMVLGLYYSDAQWHQRVIIE